MATKKETEVAEKKSTAVGQVLDFSSDAGAGLEGADAKSFAIPFLIVLQSNSPQCEQPKDGGIEGAKPGMLMNTITNQLYDSVNVVPCSYQRRFIRWAPRSSGGGYKGEYSAVDVETNNIPGMIEANGMYLMDVPANAAMFDGDGRPLFDHLSDNRNHFVLVQTLEGSWQPALFSLTSTQIKKSRRWLSRIQGIEMQGAGGVPFNPPSFSHIYKIGTVKEENAKGKWHGVDISMVGPVEDANLYNKAKEFYKQVAAGQVEVTPPPSAEEAAAGSDAEKF